MLRRACPVCQTKPELSRTFLEKNFDPSRLSAFSFASRKLPEFMCHHLVQCPTCDLVYADEPPDQELLTEAYHASDFDSAEEAGDAASAYLQAIRPLLDRLNPRDSVLEIGTGTGVFLEGMSGLGFTRLVGVEPSTAAIAAAPEHRRAWIRESIFREQDFEPGSFDLICCFMTLEHVRDPGLLVQSAKRLLRPGGAFAVVVHDYRSGINRLLGRYSPIIDIEHMQIFSPRSIRYLFQESGLLSVSVCGFKNKYSLNYWFRLLPLPGVIKMKAISVLNYLGFSKKKLEVDVGNMVAYGFRPNP
ncbi:MAG: class I SAM-dependent methyltransferase [Pseudomonadota bacterium]